MKTQKQGKGNVHDRIILCLLLLAAAMSLLAGCATPRIVAGKGDISSKKYKKVFLIVPKEDPRRIVPVVAAKLKEFELEVQTVNPDDCDSKCIGGSQGTGFLASSNGHIVTCAHVVGEEKEATIWLQGKRFETDVVCKDKEKDLAILKTRETAPFIPLQINFASDVQMGQEVYTMGFPLSNILGNSARLNKGLVNSTVGLKDDPRQIQVSVETQPGNSGGPLLDRNGVVVGIMQKTLSQAQNVNFAMKTTAIRQFIEDCPDRPPTQADSITAHSFETVKNSVVQVYSGRVTEEAVKQPKLVAVLFYSSFWDIWYRFRVFNIDFYDADTRELLLRAGQYGDNPLSTEADVIDKTFQEIRTRF